MDKKAMLARQEIAKQIELLSIENEILRLRKENQELITKQKRAEYQRNYRAKVKEEREENGIPVTVYVDKGSDKTQSGRYAKHKRNELKTRGVKALYGSEQGQGEFTEYNERLKKEA